MHVCQRNSEIDGRLRYHTHPQGGAPTAELQQVVFSRKEPLAFRRPPAPSNARNKPFWRGGGSKRANWTRAFDSNRKSQTFGRNYPGSK